MSKEILKQDILMRLVCSFYDGITPDMAKSKNRTRPLPEVRQLFSYVLKFNTKLSLNRIADEIGYKSHASVIRDIRLVDNYIDLYSDFKARVAPIIAAAKKESINFDLAKKRGIVISPQTGWICWFWNDGARFPVLGTLMYSFHNEEKQKRFISCENPSLIYLHCEYAGSDIIPQGFRTTQANHENHELAASSLR